MKKNLQILALAVLFSFLWGIWWSYYKLEKETPQYSSSEEIRILAYKGVFKPQFIEFFQKKRAIKIVLTEKNSDGDILREALSRNSEYDLIQMSSFISKSFIVDNVFAPLEFNEISNFLNVSVDFKSLDFDLDNHHFIPISWGLNGFILNAKKISLVDESLDEILSFKSKVSVLPSPTELLNLSMKIKPIIKTWVETGQSEALKKDLQDLKLKFSALLIDPREKVLDGTYDVAQMSSGYAAKILSRDSGYRFVLPKERATLWINLIGVSRGARDKELAFLVINDLLNDDINQKFVELNEQATPLETLNQSSLPLLQKASFIRQVPLSRVELFINHEALESTWLESLRREWPTVF